MKVSIEARLDALERLMSAFVAAVEAATGTKIEQPMNVPRSNVGGTDISRPRLRVIEGGRDSTPAAS